MFQKIDFAEGSQMDLVMEPPYPGQHRRNDRVAVADEVIKISLTCRQLVSAPTACDEHARITKLGYHFSLEVTKRNFLPRPCFDMSY